MPYERHCKATGLGICPASMFTDVHKIVCEATDIIAWRSVEKTPYAETAQAVANYLNPLEMEAIDILNGSD